MNHLGEVLRKLRGLKIDPTPEQLEELRAIQAEIDRLYAMIVANQEAFGVASHYVPRGSNVKVEDLPGGLNIIEGPGRNAFIKKTQEELDKIYGQWVKDMNREDYRYLNKKLEDVQVTWSFTEQGLNKHYCLTYTLDNIEHSIEMGSLTDLFKALILDVAENIEQDVMGQTRTYK